MFHAGCNADGVAVITYNYHRLYESSDRRVLHLFFHGTGSLKICGIVNVYVYPQI